MSMEQTSALCGKVVAVKSTMTDICCSSNPELVAR